MQIVKRRKAWQEFKKAHPKFEKHKSFKSDVGPMLDKIDKSIETMEQAFDEFARASHDFMALANQVAAALNGYITVARAVAQDDASITAGINEFLDEIDYAHDAEKIVTNMEKVCAGVRRTG